MAFFSAAFGIPSGPGALYDADLCIACMTSSEVISGAVTAAG